jgi:hypothetical protein
MSALPRTWLERRTSTLLLCGQPTLKRERFPKNPFETKEVLSPLKVPHPTRVAWISGWIRDSAGLLGLMAVERDYVPSLL